MSSYNKIRYATKKRDFLYLKSLVLLDDIVEIMGEVECLMADPTKSRAGAMYEASINLWFSERALAGDIGEHISPRIRKIANRYLIDI